jgi:hypothetical protein
MAQINGSEAGRRLVAQRQMKTRICANPECDEVFKTVGRGLYHSLRCRRRVRYLRDKKLRAIGKSVEGSV